MPNAGAEAVPNAEAEAEAEAEAGAGAEPVPNAEAGAVRCAPIVDLCSVLPSRFVA